jgi:D-psicose/D-tagatose/L-ribulose 3-epimerase
MKIGFCMLLWATSVDDGHTPILEDIRATGYDGVEIPIFGGTPDDYAVLARTLDRIGLERTAISIVPSPEQDPLSDDPAIRKAAVDYMAWLTECTAALGATQVGGPLHQVLGQFSGAAPTGAERARMRDFHLQVGDIAADDGVTVALEAVNRFESYFANTMDDLSAYVASVGHPAITAMYDTFHANLEEADPVAAFTRNAGSVTHVHISENDRGVPGRGHVPWPETFRAIKASGYDGWLTIEAFGRGLPDLAAATRVWRDLAESPEAVYREGYRTIRDGWDTA